MPRAEQVKLEERQVCLTDNRYVNVIRQSFAAGWLRILKIESILCYFLQSRLFCIGFIWTEKH